MEVFFNIIFFFVLFLLLAKLILRYLLPWLLKRFVNKKMKEFNDAFGNSEPMQPKEERKFGDINVDYVPPQEPKKKQVVDEEYVDFEEIDETK
ncbi:MAG: DUF4834 family protein [Bacteroidales bacterium]|nr:DUF4834 family protein [Bacteroidales bacterium]